MKKNTYIKIGIIVLSILTFAGVLFGLNWKSQQDEKQKQNETETAAETKEPEVKKDAVLIPENKHEHKAKFKEIKDSKLVFMFEEKEYEIDVLDYDLSDLKEGDEFVIQTKNKQFNIQEIVSIYKE